MVQLANLLHVRANIFSCIHGLRRGDVLHLKDSLKDEADYVVPRVDPMVLPKGPAASFATAVEARGESPGGNNQGGDTIEVRKVLPPRVDRFPRADVDSEAALFLLEQRVAIIPLSNRLG